MNHSEIGPEDPIWEVLNRREHERKQRPLFDYEPRSLQGQVMDRVREKLGGAHSATLKHPDGMDFEVSTKLTKEQLDLLHDADPTLNGHCRGVSIKYQAYNPETDFFEAREIVAVHNRSGDVTVAAHIGQDLVEEDLEFLSRAVLEAEVTNATYQKNV